LLESLFTTPLLPTLPTLLRIVHNNTSAEVKPGVNGAAWSDLPLKTTLGLLCMMASCPGIPGQEAEGGYAMRKPKLLHIFLAALAVFVVLGAVAWIVFFRNTPSIDELQGSLRHSAL
jgi:hypothetical protein